MNSPMPDGSATFLQQAYRNNWQQYLASLQPGSHLGWDVCVLTASDERQAAMYRQQLELRRKADPLPSHMLVEVVANPDDQRIGLGGATLSHPHHAEHFPFPMRRGEILPEHMLIIHSGSDLDSFGWLLAEHWSINKRMDPGCSNPFIDSLFDTMQPFICGSKLAGAGGGGFAIVLAKDGQAVHDLDYDLTILYRNTPVALWVCAMLQTGIQA